jgi:hypothetical protein
MLTRRAFLVAIYSTLCEWFQSIQAVGVFVVWVVDIIGKRLRLLGDVPYLSDSLASVLGEYRVSPRSITRASMDGYEKREAQSDDCAW